jgi:hypothetical protein
METKKVLVSRRTASAAIGLAVGSGFVAGVLSRPALGELYRGSRKVLPPSSIDDLATQAFTAPLIPEAYLLQLPAQGPSIDGQLIQDQFKSADIEQLRQMRLRPLGSSASGELSLLRYNISGVGETQSSSFFTRHSTSQDAVLMIPGSGHNRAFLAVRGRESIGQTRNRLADLCNVYVLVKPNEDTLPIHNSRYKLADENLYAWLLNMGLFYSTRYLQDAAAWVSHLKERYRRVFVIGHSQGGLAALIVSSWAAPHGVLVSNGYSISYGSQDRFMSAMGLNQMLVPGLTEFVDAQFLLNRLSDMETRVTLTYGLRQNDIYGVEAQIGLTDQAFRRALGDRFEYFVDPRLGHEWSTEFIADSIKTWMAD